MTIREMINELEELAKQHGDNTRCAIHNEYTAEDNWGSKGEDLYIDALLEFDEKKQVVVIR